MKKTFKLLSVALVLTTASQSFSMCRLSRLTSRPVLRAHRALVGVALKPTTINPRLVTTTTAHLKAKAPVANAQARAVSTSAPMRMQSSQQKEQSYNQNAFKSAYARFALGGLAAITGAGMALYDQTAKAEGANDKSNLSILKPEVDEATKQKIADLEKQITEKEKEIAEKEKTIKYELNSLKVELLGAQRKIKMLELQKLLAVNGSVPSPKIDLHTQRTGTTLLNFLEGDLYNGYFFALEGGFEGMLSLYKEAYPYLVGDRIVTLAREIIALDSERRATQNPPPFMPSVILNEREYYQGAR